MDLNLQSFRISLVLKSFFFPLTSAETFQSLRKRGFETGRSPAPVPSGPRIYVSGILGRKGKSFIDVDNAQKIVAVQGETIEESVQTFREINEMIAQDFFVKLDEDIDYVELIAHFLIQTEKNPFEVIQNSSQMKSKKRFEEIMGVDVAEYRFSIAPRGILPSSRDWFEVNVSPKLTMPEKAYWVEVVFRDTDRNKVIKFAETLNSTIASVISAIET